MVEKTESEEEEEAEETEEAGGQFSLAPMSFEEAVDALLGIKSEKPVRRQGRKKDPSEGPAQGE
jgi:hypothetical protein